MCSKPLARVLLVTLLALAPLCAAGCAGGRELSGERTRLGGGPRATADGCRSVTPCATGMRWDESSCRCAPEPLPP